MNSLQCAQIKIGILTCNGLDEFKEGDKEIIESLSNQGYKAEHIIWDNPQNDWKSYKAIVISSTWDYCKSQSQTKLFLSTLRKIHDAGVLLFNNLDIDEWMLQPFVSEIDEGEHSFIFIGKQYSHCVKKMPKPGSFLAGANSGAINSAETPSPLMLEQAQKIINVFGETSLFTRLDVIYRNDKLVVMEIEMIEPYFYSKFTKGFGDKFASELLRRLNQSIPCEQTMTCLDCSIENLSFERGIPSPDFFGKAWADEPLTNRLTETNISFALPDPDEDISLIVKNGQKAVIGQCSTNRTVKYWSHVEKTNSTVQNLSTKIFIKIQKKAVEAEKKYLKQIDEEIEQSFHNAGLAVLPEYRRNYIGSSMIKKQIELCKQHKATTLFCETTNYISARIMQKFSFVKIAEYPYPKLADELNQPSLGRLDDSFSVWCLKI